MATLENSVKESSAKLAVASSPSLVSSTNLGTAIGLAQRLQPPARLAKPQLVFNLRGWNPRPAFWVEPGWMPRIFSLSMSPHWQQVNCGNGTSDFQGISYFLMPEGTADSLYSSHYDPSSPYFFSFFGLYVIPPIAGRRVLPELCTELGNRDNLAWLTSMGDPHPNSQPKATRLVEIASRPDSDSPQWQFTCNYQLHGDLGWNNPRQNFPQVLLPPGAEVEPSWVEHVDAYQAVTMICRGFLWYEGDYLIMNYFNGVEYTNTQGQKINTYEDYPEFQAQLHRMADRVRVMNDGRPFTPPNSGSLSHW
jgi:hypothetical protein